MALSYHQSRIDWVLRVRRNLRSEDILPEFQSRLPPGPWCAWTLRRGLQVTGPRTQHGRHRTSSGCPPSSWLQTSTSFTPIVTSFAFLRQIIRKETLNGDRVVFSKLFWAPTQDFLSTWRCFDFLSRNRIEPLRHFFTCCCFCRRRRRWRWRRWRWRWSLRLEKSTSHFLTKRTNWSNKLGCFQEKNRWHQLRCCCRQRRRQQQRRRRRWTTLACR